MSIIINGVDMPEEGFVELLVWADGTVLQTGESLRIDGEDYYSPTVGEKPVGSAVRVPPSWKLTSVKVDDVLYTDIE